MAIENSPLQNTELGLLSQNWIIKKVAEVFDVKQGKQLSSKEATEGKTKRPFLRTSNVLWEKIDISKIDYMYFTDKEFNNLRLQKGDILLCEGGDIGRTAIWNDELDECAYQNHLHRLRIKPFQDYDNYFFYYWMQFAIAQRKLYIYQGNVTTIPNLSSSRLKNFAIPSPPIQEQKKIAGVLRAVQEAKEKTEEVIKAAKELKKSLMKHLFTYGPVSIEEAEKVKLKETEIGMVPVGWDIIRLADLFDFTKKPRSIHINDNDEVPFISMELISNDNKKVKAWHLKKFKEISSGTFVFKNDLVIAKITPCFENGKQAILDNIPQKFGYATTEIWAIHPKCGNIINEYLYNYIKIDSIRANLAKKMEGTTGRKRLPRHVLENFLFSLPSKDIRTQIVEILSSIDKKIEAEENKKKALEELFKTLLNILMTGKIRVHNLDIKV